MSCRIVLILLLLFSALPARAAVIKDLGTVGKTYPVVEPDILAELRDRAARHQPARKEILRRIRTYQPHDLQKLPPATKDRTFLVDMTYTLDHDLVDGSGRVIYPRGYTFNPLDYVSFPGGMVIIDGGDPVQVKWFRKSPYFKDHRVRLLITDGFAYDLVTQLRRPVFYLTKTVARRMQLTAVPSVVIQKGDKLQVREIFLKKERR